MKIWLRLLLGSIIGIITGFLLPGSNNTVATILGETSRILVNLGSYTLFPLIFFGVLTGTHSLGRKSFRLYAKTALIVAISTLALIFIGMISVLIFSPARIPPIYQEAPPLSSVSVINPLQQVFPSNMFTIFSQGSIFLLPVVVAALLIGLAARAETSAATTIIRLADALARIFYRLTSWWIEVLGIALIIISAMTIFQLRIVADFSLFNQLVVLLVVNVLFILFVLLPVMARAFHLFNNPMAWLFSLLPAALTALVSGSTSLALPVLIKTGKENLNLPRHTASHIWAFSAIFAKAGTALITGATFVLVLQSYSALRVDLLQVLWVMLAIFGVSLTVGLLPGSNVLVSLAVVAAIYGRGLDEAYLIILPILPLLASFAAFLDVVISGFVARIVANSEGLPPPVHYRNFI